MSYLLMLLAIELMILSYGFLLYPEERVKLAVTERDPYAAFLGLVTLCVPVTMLAIIFTLLFIL